MYNPKTFLTKELLTEVLENYEWGESYAIHQEDCTIDGIKVRFPKCILFFREGFESEMTLYIGDPLINNTKYWSSFELINYVFAPDFKRNGQLDEPKYLDGFHPFASQEKVKLELHNLCIAVQYYLQSCIFGDFSWVGNI